MLRTKTVVALYPFRAIEGGDLSLEKVNRLIGTYQDRDIFVRVLGTDCSSTSKEDMIGIKK